MKFKADAQPNAGGKNPRSFLLILLAISLLCLVPRVILGASQFIEYDGYWHIWIAQQDWAHFVREYQANAHPPLFFLLLKLTFLLGRSDLAYRAIPIASGAASVYLTGLIAMRATRAPVWAAAAALAYGLAMPSILISNEVRTYMLAAFLVQISFYYFLDLTGRQQPATLRPRILFAVMAALACLTEYYALIYVGAALLFALALPLIRRGEATLRGIGRELATFALILALPVWEFIVHFKGAPPAYDHLPEFYFQPGGAEAAGDFLLRTLRSELNLFSPWAAPDSAVFYAILAALALCAAAIFFLTRRWSLPKDLAAAAILFIPLAMLGAMAAGALARVYPFGGLLRQQYVLFPFFAICPFLLADRLLLRVPPKANLALAGALAAGIAVIGYQNFHAWPRIGQRLLSDQMSRYNRLFPAAPAIYIDQFNLTTFFMHHDDWKWSFVAPLPGSDTVDVYRLTHDGRSMLLFRDKDHWNLDLRDPLLYKLMARGMRDWHVPATTIFCLAQPVGKTRTEAQVAAYRARAAELSAAEGLCIQTLDLDNYDVYAEFREAGACAAARP